MKRIRWHGALASVLGALLSVACGAAPEEYTMVTHFDGRPGQSLGQVWQAVEQVPGAVVATGQMNQGALAALTEVELLHPMVSWNVSDGSHVGSDPMWQAALERTAGPSVLHWSWVLEQDTSHIDASPLMNCGSAEVFACRAIYVPVLGQHVYTCLDGAGQPLFSGSADSLVASGQCSQDELAELVQRYDQAVCVRQVPAWALPSSPILDGFVREDFVAEKVCANVDATRFEWSVDGAVVQYRVGVSFDADGQAQQVWSLNMDAYHPFSLETRWFPHLLCPSYSQQAAGFWLEVEWADGAVVIEVGESAAHSDVHADADLFLESLINTEPGCH